MLVELKIELISDSESSRLQHVSVGARRLDALAGDADDVGHKPMI